MIDNSAYMVTAYVVTAAAYLGYALSLYLRRARIRRQLRGE